MVLDVRVVSWMVCAACAGPATANPRPSPSAVTRARLGRHLAEVGDAVHATGGGGTIGAWPKTRGCDVRHAPR
ncbi:hypothetical protein D1825_00210 [Cellulomonas rhizosphaerae]|uniref:Secreted protein n=1 Tax=Cellulomonas rhizosphaerae TaxID=2293719 RepID=A0A413RRS0_9CELL|nr:hypothetical protein D1825_00210 [Cellulomonas rhizosphaerae]